VEFEPHIIAFDLPPRLAIVLLAEVFADTQSPNKLDGVPIVIDVVEGWQKIYRNM